MTLAGRTIVVTGGSRGIGRACVLDATARGARVLFCSRRDAADSRAVEVAAAARSGRSDAALGIAADVTDEAGVARLFDTARARFGAVDGVVINAAISREQLLVSMATADWDAVIDANLTGGFLVAREAARVFLERGSGGRIVAIGTLSQYGVSGNASYAASKGGLAGLIRQLARQYGHLGITASMVVCGYVETSLSATLSASARAALIEGAPLRRAGAPEEIASAVSFLLGDGAAGLDGQVLFASGGLREVPP